jgi:hypothetical protein
MFVLPSYDLEAVNSGPKCPHKQLQVVPRPRIVVFNTKRIRSRTVLFEVRSYLQDELDTVQRRKQKQCTNPSYCAQIPKTEVQ